MVYVLVKYLCGQGLELSVVHKYPDTKYFSIKVSGYPDKQISDCI